MNPNNKLVAALPIAMIGIASIIIAARLAMENKPYGWFIVITLCVGYWTTCVLEKINTK